MKTNNITIKKGFMPIKIKGKRYKTPTLYSLPYKRQPTNRDKSNNSDFDLNSLLRTSYIPLAS